jgi:hypothetical protein
LIAAVTWEESTAEEKKVGHPTKAYDVYSICRSFIKLSETMLYGGFIITLTSHSRIVVRPKNAKHSKEIQQADA